MGKVEITLSDFILTMTFFALLWYSWETRQMRKEIVDQTNFEVCGTLLTKLNYSYSIIRIKRALPF